MEKTCTKCLQRKPVEEFYRSPERAGRKRVGLLRAQCKQCMDLANHQWALNHPEQREVHRQTWLAKFPGYSRIASLVYYYSHKNQCHANVRHWAKNNPEKVLARNARRRARLRQATRLENINRKVVYLRDKGICSLCHKKVLWKDATMDHIIPLAQGGEHTYANVSLAHRSCNSRKGNRAMTQQMRLF